MINTLMIEDNGLSKELYTTTGERRNVHLLRMHLTAFVPVVVEQFLSGQRVLVMPRPDLSNYLAENGDALIYPAKDRTRKAMAALTEALATGAFCPGGVKAFGLHFEVPLDVIKKFRPEFFESRIQQTRESTSPPGKNEEGTTPFLPLAAPTFEQVFRQLNRSKK